MACNANPGQLVATAHGNTIKKAILHAFGALQSLGDAACAGGNCANGNCEWIVESVQFTAQFDQDTNDYVATATGTGSCHCV
ncbi:MAG TPA: hypothetical protein VIW64_03050 [Pyrinomonadaceae bacterium]|jgi:hypothetical protein